MLWRGIPEHIRSDNGPEFIARELRQWLGNLGTGTLYIEPGSPWENGYCESFNVGDSTALPGLLDQLDAPVTGFLADGAYDGASTRNLLRQRYGETLDVVIPPPKDAVIRPQSARDATVRDRHIAQIRSNGCMAWQTATGYNQRSRIETQMGRWKSVIGPKLKFRSFSRQITEVQLGRKVLNTMTALGRPVFERIS